jgi:hypothetical protein
MRGDLLLLKSTGTPRDRLVAWATGGSFVHVEVDLGDGTTIGSHQKDGVSYRQVRLPEFFVTVPLSERVPAEKIEAGIAWMKEQLGHPFSWASMADFVFPEWVGTQIWGRTAIYNCANLVARYLDITGGLELVYGKRPLSPNDIARSEGLL